MILWARVGACGSQKQVSGHLKLALQAAVCHHMGSGKLSALNCLPPSWAPVLVLNVIFSILSFYILKLCTVYAVCVNMCVHMQAHVYMRPEDKRGCCSLGAVYLVFVQIQTLLAWEFTK